MVDRKQRLLVTVHETAQGLRDEGFIDARRMKDYDRLCLPTLAHLSVSRIVQIRQRAKVSQTVFATVLNTSVKTVQSWEQGLKKPSGTALRLLDVIERKGIDALV